MPSKAPQTHLSIMKMYLNNSFKRTSNAPQTHLSIMKMYLNNSFKRTSNAPHTHLSIMKMYLNNSFKRTSNAPHTHLSIMKMHLNSLKRASITRVFWMKWNIVRLSVCGNCMHLFSQNLCLSANASLKRYPQLRKKSVQDGPGQKLIEAFMKRQFMFMNDANTKKYDDLKIESWNSPRCNMPPHLPNRTTHTPSLSQCQAS